MPHRLARVIDREASAQPGLCLHQEAVADEEQSEVAQQRRQPFVVLAERALRHLHRLAERGLRGRAVAGSGAHRRQQPQSLGFRGRLTGREGQRARHEGLGHREVRGGAGEIHDTDCGRGFLGNCTRGPRRVDGGTQVRDRS